MKQFLPKLEAYQQLISRYHRTLDLVSDAGLHDLPRLLEEALLYADLMPEPRPLRWLDLGSGAGLPAIPLAIRYPEIGFMLVERRRRRAAFLQLTRAKLNLDNVTIFEGDVADLESGTAFNVLSAQAVGSFGLLYRLTRHLLAPEGMIIARKGVDWRRELAELEALLSPIQPLAQELELPRHGRLVAVKLNGGQPCPLLG